MSIKPEKVKEIDEDLKELGMVSQRELTGDKIPLEYLMNLTIIFYVQSVSQGNDIAAYNLMNTMEAMLSAELDEYPEYRKTVDGLDQEMKNNINSLKGIADLDRDFRMKSWRREYAHKKFSALVKVLNYLGKWGVGKGGVYLKPLGIEEEEEDEVVSGGNAVEPLQEHGSEPQQEPIGNDGGANGKR